MSKIYKNNQASTPEISVQSRVIMLVIGVFSLVMVPVFNYATGLPPFMGVLLGMVVLWIYTDLMYGHQTHIKEQHKYRVARIFSLIDLSTIMFFLGILLSVAALQSAGQLRVIADFLNNNAKDPLIISFFIGIISSVLDNVALVAATMGMYPVVDAGAEMANYFAVNGQFWTFLVYCAVTGGSILIIGSATGVTVMGLEKISFIYYLKRFTLIAFVGYVCGAATFLLMSWLF